MPKTRAGVLVLLDFGMSEGSGLEALLKDPVRFGRAAIPVLSCWLPWPFQFFIRIALTRRVLTGRLCRRLRIIYIYII